MKGQKKPEVAVVIIAYNEEKRIQTVVQYALRQSVTSYVIVVDDASSDQTARIARESGAHRVITLDENIGPAGARNRGLAEVGDIPFVGFLDADDKPTEEYLKVALSILNEKKSNVIATGPVRYHDGDDRMNNNVRRGQKVVYSLHFFLEAFMRRGGIITEGGFVAKTDVMQYIHGFDEKFRYCYGEGAALASKIKKTKKKKWRIVYSPTLVMDTSKRRIVEEGMYRQGVILFASAIASATHPNVGVLLCKLLQGFYPTQSR